MNEPTQAESEITCPCDASGTSAAQTCALCQGEREAEEKKTPKQARGFALMDDDRHRAVSSEGGRAAQAAPVPAPGDKKARRAHLFTKGSPTAIEAGRRSGEARRAKKAASRSEAE